MGFLSWIVLGLLAGLIARAVVPGEDPLGWVFTTLLGIGGAIVGGLAGTQLGMGSVDSLDLRSLGIALCGAIALLLIRRSITRGEVV